MLYIASKAISFAFIYAFTLRAEHGLSATPDSLWQNRQFRIYLGSTGLSGVATSMQQLLITWLLVGILVLPAAQVGVIQALIGLPGLILMLFGGASADRADPRTLLIRAPAVPPGSSFPHALLALVWLTS